MSKPLYRLLAETVDALKRCQKRDNVTGWEAIHQARAEALVRAYMPSGAGWNAGTHIDLDASTGDKLVFFGSFQHMSEHGYYTGWTDHRITVTGSLAHGIELKISGRNKNDIKDYLHGLFWEALRAAPADEVITELYKAKGCFRPWEDANAKTT